MEDLGDPVSCLTGWVLVSCSAQQNEAEGRRAGGQADLGGDDKGAKGDELAGQRHSGSVDFVDSVDTKASQACASKTKQASPRQRQYQARNTAGRRASAS